MKKEKRIQYTWVFRQVGIRKEADKLAQLFPHCSQLIVKAFTAQQEKQALPSFLFLPFWACSYILDLALLDRLGNNSLPV